MNSHRKIIKHLRAQSNMDERQQKIQAAESKLVRPKILELSGIVYEIFTIFKEIKENIRETTEHWSCFKK